VPSAKFDDARRQLEALGSLRGENLSGQDAGGQLADLTAQLADLHAEQAGLRTMAQHATRTSDLLAIEAQLATVQQQIDGLTAQQAQLQNQVSLASITVTMEEATPIPSVPPARSVLSARMAQAGHGIEAMTGGIVVVLAYSAPLVILAGLGALVVLGVRRRRADPVPTVAS
jgi:hypothetical protein